MSKKMGTIGISSKRRRLSRFLTVCSIVFACLLPLYPAFPATLAWDPNPEIDINGYILHYGTNSGQYTITLNVGNTTNATVTGLSSNITYYFAVTAYNTSGLESDFSNEVSYNPGGTNSAVFSRLTVRTNGVGTVTPDLNGQLLEVGKGYAITAVPGTGYTFTNWTGDIVTNTAQLTFVMRSNLTVTANFVGTVSFLDTIPPTVSITSPAANAQVTNGTVIFQGAASDNNAVSQVLWQIGSGAFQLATGTTNWSASVTLSPGTNVVSVKSVDAAGNQSALASQAISYVADAIKPTIAITSPAANTRITNTTVTLHGTSSDHRGIAQVLYQLGNGLFQVAAGTTNWSATLSLVAGPNTISVKSVDIDGNASDPVNTTITCVMFSPLTVRTNGSGAISPLLNGQLLEIGKNYTLTATPASGFGFAGWSGGVSTNSSQLVFAMQSNLVLIANFVDAIKPTIYITAPLANSRLTNSVVTVQGKAADNKGVARVLYQVGSGSFQPASGTTNWSASITLVPGPNLIRVKSVDLFGNESLPVSETVTYVVWSRITVGTNGNGVVSPNLNGQLLEIAKTYSLGAVQGLGFAFTNWTGSATTNKPVITFAMQSNLVLTANFVDVLKPAVIITAPLANARVTNGTITLQGRASDNKAVLQVLCQLGSGPYQAATGTTNWSASLSLVPGPNVVHVKAIDAAGNESLPVSETITYVVWSRIIVSTNGNGIVLPNLNGQLLEIAKTYSLYPYPGPGFLFTNWTGGISTNRALLTFSMRSNLVLTANFIDVMKPTVSIISPVANARVTNATVTFQGRAADNKAVVRVLYQLGNGPFQDAAGTSNWSATVELTAGPNTFRVKSVDSSGLESLPLTQTITFVVLSPLTVRVSGSGTVSPNLDGRLLEIGAPFTLVAAPGVGYVFSNWIGGISSENPQLSFKMQSNLVLTAQFVPNPFLASQGNYNGLFYETNGVSHESSGFFKLALNNLGSFAGFFMGAGVTVPLSGHFTVAGTFQHQIPRPGLPAITLSMNVDQQDQPPTIKGTITDGIWVAELLADRGWSQSAAQSWHGYYTLAIPADPSGGPEGAGHAAVWADTLGNLLLQGKLADGQPISQTVQISETGQWPLYVPLYAGKGSLLSWITFTNSAAGDLQGLISWIKKSQPGTIYYPAGFTNETMVVGSHYTPPTTNPVVHFTVGQVLFSGGNLPYTLTNAVTIDSLGRVSNHGPVPMTFSINAASGAFGGSFRAPDSGMIRAFEGVLIPFQTAGFGFFLGNNQSGEVRFEPAP